MVSIERSDSIYSGVLVGRRHVLTAAHVIDTALPPSSYRVRFNLSATPIVVEVEWVTRNPTYGGIGVNDLALLRLAQDAPSQSLAYGLPTANPPLGATFMLVGYGDSGNGDSGLTVSRNATVKRAGANVFDFTPDGRIYYFDFDGPTSATNYLGGATLGNAVETSLAGGDSGGPALAQIGGQSTVVGINAFVAYFHGGPTTPGIFGTAGGGSLVAPHRDWIEATLSASGVESVDIPLPPWASALLAVLLLASLAARHSKAIVRAAHARRAP